MVYQKNGKLRTHDVQDNILLGELVQFWCLLLNMVRKDTIAELVKGHKSENAWNMNELGQFFKVSLMKA